MRLLAPALAGMAACGHARGPEAGPGEASTEAGTTLVDASESGAGNAGDLGEAGGFVVRGGTVVGIGRVDVLVRGGRIAGLGDFPASPFDLDASGRFIVPAFVDSHVHLAYAFDAQTLASGGLAAAVDLAAPLSFLEEAHDPLQLRAAGPMITAVDGYPTQTWGAGGFGLEVRGVIAARRAVDRIADAGASLVKVPIGEAPALDDDELAAVVAQAHRRGLPVAAHALTDADATRAAAFGVDVLAHTPIERLSESCVQAWSDRTVISTLEAFGGTADTIDNLRRLREAGTTVLYGTDLGNTGIPAIDPNEIALLGAAGLDGAAILAAGTSNPAKLWGFEGLGELSVGSRASLLVLEADPIEDPLTLASPLSVILDGEVQPKPWNVGTGIKG